LCDPGDRAGAGARAGPTAGAASDNVRPARRGRRVPSTR
jgi:hypothetical protein